MKKTICVLFLLIFLTGITSARINMNNLNEDMQNAEQIFHQVPG